MHSAIAAIVGRKSVEGRNSHGLAQAPAVYRSVGLCCAGCVAFAQIVRRAQATIELGRSRAMVD